MLPEHLGIDGVFPSPWQPVGVEAALLFPFQGRGPGASHRHPENYPGASATSSEEPPSLDRQDLCFLFS